MSEPSASRSDLRAALRWLPALVPLAIGAVVGYRAAYEMTLPNLAPILGVVLLFILGGAFLIVAAVGAVAMAANHGSFGLGALVAAACLLVGGAAGFGSVRAFDLGFHYPVILKADGTARADISGVRFIPVTDGPAACDSAPDATAVARVTALALGDLDRKGMLRAEIDLGPGSLGSINLFIDAGSTPDVVDQPAWSAQATFVSTNDGQSGTARFANAILTFSFEKSPIASDPSSGAANAGWPLALSGSVTWDCLSWTAANATSPPSVAGRVTLELPGLDLGEIPTTPSVTCFFDNRGALSSIISDGVYQLQHWPLEIQIGLGSPIHVDTGAAVQIMLSGKNPPPGQTYKPNWGGKGMITEVSPDGRSGTLTFADLPTGVDPSVGPAPSGWPVSLTGSLTWTCA